MKVIYKYMMKNFTDAVRMHRDAQIIHVGFQETILGSCPMIWAIVDPELPEVFRKIEVVGTGWDLEGEIGKHLGSVQVDAFVWHFFDHGESPKDTKEISQILYEADYSAAEVDDYIKKKGS